MYIKMKKEFSKEWKASKQPRKQRKYLANAPLHIKRKKLSVALSKDLRKKMSKRNVVVRKDDEVKVMKGKFKGKIGKILEVFTKQSKVVIEGVQVSKKDGSKSNVKMQPCNLQIIKMVDRKMKPVKTKEEIKTTEVKKENTKKEEVKKELKQTNKEEKKK